MDKDFKEFIRYLEKEFIEYGNMKLEKGIKLVVDTKGINFLLEKIIERFENDWKRNQMGKLQNRRAKGRDYKIIKRKV